MRFILISFITTLLIISCKAQKGVSLSKNSDLQEFITELENGTEYTFEKQSFNREEPLIIEGKEGLVLDFSGSTIISNTSGENVKPLHKKERNWPRNRSHVIIKNSKNIKILNLNIDGPHSNGGTSEKAYVRRLEAQHAYEIINSKNIVIEGANIKEIYGDGIYISKRSSQILIQNCNISKNGRQGIAITEGFNIEIKNNEFNEIRRAHIDLECNHNSDTIKNITISGNVFGSKRLKWIAAASSKGIVTEVTVKNNKINSTADIYLGNVKNKRKQGPYYFYDNSSHKGYGNPQGIIWKLFNVNGFTAEGNQIRAQAYRDMHLVGGRNVTNLHLNNNFVSHGSPSFKKLGN
ncbi:right-handed parallel beta-helix repeat-containing protein [Mangrovivirga sp. M17]|uniref:Right-handed parallel beta-helix repeat-containing protein n=1 Tax=Mangrovivirga halotolerans TaxID=2993936 RepID=A0ABT3RUB9_9BACT|nr:right-handed parallel beta-helix repeat-containing protein [Mangrovivirga halotolerans]MCX2745203.1 right-handed parallel beta-helix repeat-containing protein [Mangrovivirga halotolerans]